MIPANVRPRKPGGLHRIVVMTPETKTVGGIRMLALRVGRPRQVWISKQVGVVAAHGNMLKDAAVAAAVTLVTPCF